MSEFVPRKWRNTRDELPDDGKWVLVKVLYMDDPESLRFGYHAYKRDGKYFSCGGCTEFLVSRDAEKFWIYIDEIEACCE